MTFSAPDNTTVSRIQLISWVNEEFELSLTKVEQCGTGAVYLLILDKLFWPFQCSGEGPTVPMNRVRWDTENIYDYEENYKLLQKVFSSYQIQKHIPVKDLMKARMQDNLAFLQFLFNLFTKYHQPDDSFPGGWARRCTSQRQSFKPWASAPQGAQSRGGGGGALPARENKPPAPRGRKPVPSARAPAPPARSATGRSEYRNARPAEGNVGALQAKIVELEQAVDDADYDISVLNEERAKYYVKLLALEKLRCVRSDAHGSDQACITPDEILACIDAEEYPEDIKQFASEFHYENYLDGSTEQ